MSQKLIYLSILFSLLFAPLYPVYAETSTSSADVKPINKLEQKLENRENKILNNLDDRLEKIASRAADLKNRLAKFRDQKKAQLVQRINDQLNMINKNQTDSMINHLTTMSSILDKVDERSKSGNANTTDVQTAIANARAKIASASAAVTAQAAKDYTIQVSSESGVKADAMKSRDALHSDLKSTRDLVQEAKQSVAQAINAFAQALGGATK